MGGYGYHPLTPYPPLVKGEVFSPLGGLWFGATWSCRVEAVRTAKASRAPNGVENSQEEERLQTCAKWKTRGPWYKVPPPHDISILWAARWGIILQYILQWILRWILWWIVRGVPMRDPPREPQVAF